MYIVTGSGSKTIKASAAQSNYNTSATVTAECFADGTTLNYKLSTVSSERPYMIVTLYVNDQEVYSSGYVTTNGDAFPRGNGTSYSGSCSIPSTGNVTLQLKIGVSTSAYNGDSGKQTLIRETTTYYQVTFTDGLEDILKIQDVVSGGQATPPPDPTRKGYKFTGWSGSYSNVTSDREIIATWKKINNMAINSNGQIKKGKPWIRNKSGTPWIKINGIWEKGE